MKNYKFYSHRECEYFPCHKTNKPEEFNCLFCYCPLYMLGDKCGGNFRYTAKGIKDCSKCILPHVKDKGYDYVRNKMTEVLQTVKQTPSSKN